MRSPSPCSTTVPPWPTPGTAETVEIPILTAEGHRAARDAAGRSLQSDRRGGHRHRVRGARRSRHRAPAAGQDQGPPARGGQLFTPGGTRGPVLGERLLTLTRVGAPDGATPARGDRSGSARVPKSCRSALSAACHPQSPCTPGPGVTDAEDRYTPGMGVRHGSGLSTGRRSSCASFGAPAAMSPPT